MKPKKTLRELIEEILYDTYAKHGDEYAWAKWMKKDIDSILSLFSQFADEIIGEDDDLNKIEDGYDLTMAEGANQFRKAQRARKEELLG